MERLRKQMGSIAFCLTVLLPFYFASPALSEKLTMDITQLETNLHVKASLDQEARTYEIDSKEMIVQKLKTIYYLLEPKENETGTIEDTNRFLKQQMETLRGFLKIGKDASQQASAKNSISIPAETRILLEKVGAALFQPVHEYIEVATVIEFVINEDDLLFPLDALFYQDRPLFLHKPVVYTLDHKPETYFTASKDWRGCMISDPETASGKAVQRVKEYFPNSRLFNSQETRYEDILKIGTAEFLLICASGGPEGIELPHLAIRSWSLATLKPELAYLDADKFGLNIDFIKAFQQAGTNYYIGPIFIYKSDDAATKTMERFFQALSKGNSPSYALYLTRKTIYDESLMMDNDFRWVMRQAFPFRVYRLN